jgi:tRNA pseudouridine13 synthase
MQEPPPEDSEIGIETYVTQTPGLGGRIRASAHHFIVEEVLKPNSLNLTTEGLSRGRAWSYFILEKVNITTIDAVTWLSRTLGSQIRYLGLKDRRAKAIQHIAIRTANPPPRLESADGRIRLRYIGSGTHPLTRRQLLGNRFTVWISDADITLARTVLPHFEEGVRRNVLANFYGPQRFGLRGPGTHRVGEAIIKRRFDLAVHLLTQRTMSSPYQFEQEAVRYLSANPGRYLEALRRVPLKIRRLLVQAYQSFLFNKTLSLALQCGETLSQVRAGDVYASIHPVEGVSKPLGRATGNQNHDASKVPLVPLVGYTLKPPKGRWERLLLQVLKEEGVTPQDFYIKELQELSLEGGFRPAPLVIPDFQYRVGPEAVQLNFTLYRGSYATILLRELMKPQDYVGAGF